MTNGGITMNEKNIIKTSILIGIIIAAFCLIISYNSFVSVKADVDLAQSNIEAAMQARREYNKAVNDYNRKIDAFPGNIYAKFFGFEKLEEFKADENAHKTSVVDFGN